MFKRAGTTGLGISLPVEALVYPSSSMEKRRTKMLNQYKITNENWLKCMEMFVFYVRMRTLKNWAIYK